MSLITDERACAGASPRSLPTQSMPDAIPDGGVCFVCISAVRKSGDNEWEIVTPHRGGRGGGVGLSRPDGGLARRSRMLAYKDHQAAQVSEPRLSTRLHS